MNPDFEVDALLDELPELAALADGPAGAAPRASADALWERAASLPCPIDPLDSDLLRPAGPPVRSRGPQWARLAALFMVGGLLGLGGASGLSRLAPRAGGRLVHLLRFEGGHAAGEAEQPPPPAAPVSAFAALPRPSAAPRPEAEPAPPSTLDAPRMTPVRRKQVRSNEERGTGPAQVLSAVHEVVRERVTRPRTGALRLAVSGQGGLLGPRAHGGLQLALSAYGQEGPRGRARPFVGATLETGGLAPDPRIESSPAEVEVAMGARAGVALATERGGNVELGWTAGARVTGDGQGRPQVVPVTGPELVVHSAPNRRGARVRASVRAEAALVSGEDAPRIQPRVALGLGADLPTRR